MSVLAVEAAGAEGAAAPEAASSGAARKAPAKKAPAKKPAPKKTPAKSAPASSSGRHAKKPASRVDRAKSGAREGAAGGAKKAGQGLNKALAGRQNRGLLAQYLICMTVLGAGTMVPTPVGRPQEGVPHLMVKGSGLSLLFFVLSLTAATGDKARRAATGLGAVVTVGYLVTSSDAYNILSWIKGFYSKPGTPGAGVTASQAQDAGLVTYTPAVPYPWVVQTQVPTAGGPPGTTTGGSGELTA